MILKYKRFSISQTARACTACGAVVAAILWHVHEQWHEKNDK